MPTNVEPRKQNAGAQSTCGFLGLFYRNKMLLYFQISSKERKKMLLRVFSLK